MTKDLVGTPIRVFDILFFPSEIYTKLCVKKMINRIKATAQLYDPTKVENLTFEKVQIQLRKISTEKQYISTL